MERNDNCSLECLLHRLFLTSPTLSNHGARIRCSWKGSVLGFLLCRNTLGTKPFTPSWGFTGCTQGTCSGPKHNSPQTPQAAKGGKAELCFPLWCTQWFSLSALGEEQPQMLRCERAGEPWQQDLGANEATKWQREQTRSLSTFGGGKSSGWVSPACFTSCLRACKDNSSPALPKWAQSFGWAHHHSSGPFVRDTKTISMGHPTSFQPGYVNSSFFILFFVFNGGSAEHLGKGGDPLWCNIKGCTQGILFWSLSPGKAKRI